MKQIFLLALAPLLVGATLPLFNNMTIEAHLFNAQTGTLSEDVLAPVPVELGNIPASDYASVATLVLVKVGPRLPMQAKIRLVARERAPRGGRGRILLDRTTSVGPVGADRMTHVGFWLDKTGCTPIDLKASLLGEKPVLIATASLNFSCYE